MLSARPYRDVELPRRSWMSVPQNVEPLVEATELAGRLAAGERIVVLDVRWALTPGRDEWQARYRAGHLPGAVFVDLDAELAAPPTAAGGRHPLPEPGRLEAAARRWGINRGDPVVAYDTSGGLAAARAWWLLRWAGHTDVRLLDGGIDAWTAAGGVLDAGEVVPVPGNVTLGSGRLPVVDADGAARVARAGVLLDARAAERYRGALEPVDPRAGHIPGALSAPTADNLEEDGRFRPAVKLGDRFAALGVVPGRPVAVYCGSGVNACHQVFALMLAGMPAALYAGSWSQWSNDPARPVATGGEAG
jgi:thiosulfate/3-mercaptopyruvate sulfurtransferase